MSQLMASGTEKAIRRSTRSMQLLMCDAANIVNGKLYILGGGRTRIFHIRGDAFLNFGRSLGFKRRKQAEDLNIAYNDLITAIDAGKFVME